MKSLLFSFLTLILASSAMAGNFNLYGVSAWDRAQGGATTASSTGMSATYRNPAGLSHATHNTFEFSTAGALPFEKLTLQTGQHEKIRASGGFVIGFGLKLKGDFLDRVAVGFVFYSPYIVLTRARTVDPATPYFYRYDSTPSTYAISSALSFQWFDWLSTGLGVQIGVGQRGQIGLAVDILARRYDEQAFDAAQFSIASPLAGIRLGPFNAGPVVIDFGAAYRGSLSQPVSIIADLELSGLDLNLGLPLLSTTNFTPERYSAGLALTLFDRIAVEADLDYAMWSQAPSPFLSAGLTITGQGADELGIEGALDAPEPTQSRIRPAGFINTLNLRSRLGVNVFDKRLLLSAGYGYRPTPVPNQTTATNILDNNAHLISLGTRVFVNAPWLAKQPIAFSAGVQTHLFAKRIIEKERADNPLGTYESTGAVVDLSTGVRFSF